MELDETSESARPTRSFSTYDSVLGPTSRWEKLGPQADFDYAPIDASFISHRTVVHPYTAPSEGLTAYGGMSFSSLVAPLYAYHLRSSREDELVRAGRKPSQTTHSLYNWCPGTWLYGGELRDHFGHAMSECTHRLYPLTGRNAASRRFARSIDGVVFASRSQHLAPYMKVLLGAYYNLRPEQIRLVVQKPTVFETLVHAPQGSFLGAKSALPGYLEHLRSYHEQNVARHRDLPDRPRLFLPRRHILNSHGTVSNEHVIQGMLERYGFIEFRPEEYPLDVQFAVLSQARQVAVVGGSAVHAFEHLGRLHATSLLIGRGDRDSFYHPRPLAQRFDSLHRMEPSDEDGDRVVHDTLDGKVSTTVAYNATKIADTISSWLDD